MTRFDYFESPTRRYYVNVKGDDGGVTEWGFELGATAADRGDGVIAHLLATRWTRSPSRPIRCATGAPRAAWRLGAVTADGKTFGNVAGIPGVIVAAPRMRPPQGEGRGPRSLGGRRADERRAGASNRQDR